MKGCFLANSWKHLTHLKLHKLTFTVAHFYVTTAQFDINCTLKYALAFCIRVCPSVSEWVSLCVPKTLWTPYLKNQWRQFHTVLATDVFGFVCTDYLLGSKGQGHNRRMHNRPRKTFEFRQVCISVFLSVVRDALSSTIYTTETNRTLCHDYRRRNSIFDVASPLNCCPEGVMGWWSRDREVIWSFVV